MEVNKLFVVASILFLVGIGIINSQGLLSGTPVSIIEPREGDGVIVMQKEHYEIHEGDHYFVKGVLDITGAGQTQYFMFRTPNNGKRIHAKALISAEAEFKVEILEGGTTLEDGTIIPHFNNNRDSSNVGSLAPTVNPIVLSDGTPIWTAQTGTSGKSTGVANSLNYEIIAKTNEVYFFKLTKEAASTHYVDFDFWWYEEALD